MSGAAPHEAASSQTPGQQPHYEAAPQAAASQPSAGAAQLPQGPAPTGQIIADDSTTPENQSDADSVYGSDDDSARTTSLASSIRKYKYENGRRYHSFRDGSYFLPNDESEQDRLDLVHHIFRLALDGALYRAPVSRDMKRVLDFGTGTGIWAIDIADEFPDAQVIGTDLSPIQPGWVAPNCSFYVDDCESDWSYPPNEAFDFIHARVMSGAIRDWPRLFGQVLRHLKPGGWFEIQDHDGYFFSDDDPELKSARGVAAWQDNVNEASSGFGKDINVPIKYTKLMRDAGFIDVVDDIYKMPVGTWPKDPKMKEIGRYNFAAVHDGLEAYALGMLTRVRNWTKEECEVLVAKARADFKNRSNHLYAKYHYVYGRKQPNATAAA